jgi:excisionase family DNA binding protein
VSPQHAVADETRTLTQAILDVVARQPGITRSELAQELGIDPSMLATLRGALDAVSADRQVDEDPAFVARWGSAPSPDQISAARLAAEAMRRDAIAAVLNGALTRDQAAERLGITAQAVSERLKARTLTAIRRGREWRFPAWQFTDDATLPALKQLIEAWPGTELSLSAWAIKPSVDLDGIARRLWRRGPGSSGYPSDRGPRTLLDLTVRAFRRSGSDGACAAAERGFRQSECPTRI